MINEDNTQIISLILKKLVFIYELPDFDKVEEKDQLYLKEMNKYYETQKEFNKNNFVTIKSNLKFLILKEYFKTNKDIDEYIALLSQTQIIIQNKTIRNSIADEIINGYSNIKTLEKHEDRIIRMFLKKFCIQDRKELKLIINEDKGVNQGYILRTTKEEYYIKTMINDYRLNTKGKIDFCEILVYKIMEYTGFGPETSFLIELGSCDMGSITTHREN
jgi:hypothetical protein